MKLYSHTGRISSMIFAMLLSGYALIAGYTNPVAAEPAPAIVDVHPKIINKQAIGQYVTVYIEFDESCSGCDVQDIDVSTVTIQSIDPVTSIKLHVATGSPTEVGDGNGNGVVDRMVKFDRATVNSWFAEGTGQVTFRVDGQFFDGQQFEGTDTSVMVK